MSPVLTAALCGLLSSVAIERLMQPRPGWKRPLAAWLLHAGMWLIAYSVLVLVLGRPWFSCISVLAFFLTLVMVNNAKVKALREPFLFQDYDYFTDAIRHPRLYIPFLGWGKFFAALLGFCVAVAIGLLGESVAENRWHWSGQLGDLVLLTMLGASLIAIGDRARLPVYFMPRQDLLSLGYLAYLWRYYREGRAKPRASSPFHALTPRSQLRKLPHLVAVQSESFFDPRPLYDGIREDVLASFDEMKSEAVSSGKLLVPAWGANTVRSEFAFLCGVEASALGIHQFNPYRALAAGWPLSSVASYLKQLGYRTLCIHPYPADFYLRAKVYPLLGFDEFWDISHFDEAQRYGPYISDAAVAQKIADVLDQADQPVFVFAITMENHGPLHLEKVQPEDVEALYREPPPPRCEDLTIYLRHLRNADRMVDTLQQRLSTCKWQGGASLCWYGDHVPIMSTVYETFGAPAGNTEYLIWQSNRASQSIRTDIQAHDLALNWLWAVNLA